MVVVDLQQALNTSAIYQRCHILSEGILSLARAGIMSLLSVRVTLIVCTVTASPHVRSQSTRTLLSFVRLPGSPHSHFPVHCFKTAILLDIVVEIAMEVASSVQIYVYLRCSKCTHPYYCVPTLHRNFQGRMGLLSWVIIHRLHEDELPDDRKSSAVTSGELGRNEVSKRRQQSRSSAEIAFTVSPHPI